MRPIRLAVLVAPTLLAASLLAPSTRAQPLVAFDPPTYLSAGNSPVSVATGDFNGDDDPDLAVANRFSSDVSVLLGGAAGGFTGPTSFPTGFFSNSVAVGNFNADQDSDPDLTVAEESGQVRVLLGSSGGGFAGPTAVLSGSQVQGGLSSVAVGDVSLDGDPDLVIAHRSGNQVRVLLGGPGGSFGAPTNFPTGTLPASVAVADFNADSKPDLTTTHNVSVLLNTTVTNRAPTANPDAYSTTEDTPLTVAAPGVLANDSDPEHDPLSAVLVSGPSHGTLTLNPDGSFTYTPASNHTGSDSFTYQAGDGTLHQSWPR
jgi:hypothetical protein